MFQREVAERICAAPGAKAYGRLGVLAGWRTEARIAFDVPPQAFTPPPKVTSSVVHLVPQAGCDRGAGEGARGGDPRRLRPAPQDDPAKPQRAWRAGRRSAGGRGLEGEERAEELPVSAFLAMAAIVAGR